MEDNVGQVIVIGERQDKVNIPGGNARQRSRSGWRVRGTQRLGESCRFQLYDTKQPKIMYWVLALALLV